MRITLLLLSLLLGHWSPAHAQEPCFCLRDVHDNWLRGCERRESPVTRQPQVFCKTTAIAVPTKVTVFKGWSEVKDGDDGCKPCAPLLTPVQRSPRGGKEEQP